MSKYEDYWYQSQDQLKLYARDYNNVDDKLAPVLCMHGLTRNSADFSGLADHLAVNRRVIVPDQRGRGRSQYDSNSANYNPATYVQDMTTMMASLKLQQTVLIGTSMGGLMAMMMAAMQPGQFQAIILNDIGPEVDPAGLERIQGYVGKSAPVTTWDEAVNQTREINGEAFPNFTDQEWKKFTEALYRDENGCPVLAHDPSIADPISQSEDNAVPPDLWPLFDAIANLPILLIRGAHSDILAPACVEEMQRRKPDIHVAEIPQRGHAPTLDEHESRTAIDQFLAQL